MPANVVSSTLVTPALQGMVFQVGGVWLEEALDHPFAATVTLELAPGQDLDTAAVVNDEATLVLERPGLPPRRLVGMVERARQDRRRPDGETVIELRVVPALALLGYTRNTRIFQDQSAIEILEAVLGEGLGAYGREVQVLTSEEYPKREYCVQYQESDLHFAQRLMEEEGITYAFDHEGEVEVMGLYDRNDDQPELADAVVPYVPTWAEVSDQEGVVSVAPRRTATTTSVVVLDYDFSGPTGHTDETRGSDPMGRDRESYEHGWGAALTIGDYDEGVGRYQAQDATRQAQVRQEGFVVRDDMIVGLSRARGLAPGRRFTLSGHELDGDYLVVSVQHEDRVPDDVGPESDDGYHNRFEAIPVGVPYRPERRTPKPQIHSVLHAVITGPGGEEIHTDSHGRVKVQFPWDREGANDEHTTCWLRVSQPWAGSGWGFVYIPRIGMEATVAFAHGDPDKPVVLATQYNGTHLPPYELPGEKSKSTIKSESTIGRGGFNELRFEDAKGDEQVYIHAQKDFDEEVENNHTTTVGHDQENHVGNDQTQNVHGKQVEEITSNQSMTVKGKREVFVFGGFDETIDTGEERTVLEGSTETIIGDEKRMITGGSEEAILGGETRTLIGNQTELITTSVDQTVVGASSRVITGSLSCTALGPILWNANATYTLTAIAGFTLTGTGGIMIMAPTINVTTSNEKEQDGSTVTKLVGTKTSQVGLSIGVDGIAISTVGTAFGNVGLAVDIGSARAEAAGCNVGISNIKLGICDVTPECGAVLLQRKSVRLIN